MTKIVAMDIETDSLDATRIWVVCGQDVDTGETHQFLNVDTIPEERDRFIEFCSTVDRFVFHNGIGFDVGVINRLVKKDCINPFMVVDTLVLSRLIDYGLKGGHGLKAWGKRLGDFKMDFNDFSVLTQEMIDYCHQDVVVTTKLYKKFLSVIQDPAWKDAIRCEHDIQILCEEMTSNGFYFEKEPADHLLDEIELRKVELEEGFQVDFPPQLEEVNRILYRKKKDGTPVAGVANAIVKYAKTKVDKSVYPPQLICYDWVEFNPASPKMRIERLWDAGWKPVDKTKGHIEHHRLYFRYGRPLPFTSPKIEDRGAKFARYGWTLSETNLSTLPETAPTGAKRLTEWLTLEGRRSSLVEWLGHCGDDSRIHGRFMGIGAWTGRMAHKAPNQANIPSEFHGDPKSSVDEVKAKYDGQFRALWSVPDDSWLVGTDAEGIQLRVLAHLMKSEEYVHAIVSGKKEDETDIHNLNRKALGMSHITRDMAKTFIYAFLLGAGTAKISHILKVNQREAKQAVDNFMESIPDLADLKKKIIPHVAKRGYFKGLDGRKVVVPSEHKALAGMLQNGESVIMKHAALQWTRVAKLQDIPFKLVTWPHDEWQTEVKGSYQLAEQLGDMQRQSIVDTGAKFNMLCPLAGSTDIGKNWKDTH